MNERENLRLKGKRIKIENTKIEMEIDVPEKKKSNFSSLGSSSSSGSTNGSIVRGNGSAGNSKGDIKKLVIKNFKSKYPHDSCQCQVFFLFKYLIPC